MSEYLFAFGFDEKTLFFRPKIEKDFKQKIQETVFNTLP